MRKSSLVFRAGLMLIMVGVLSSLPYMLTVAGDPFGLELGEAWGSPVGAALGAIAIITGCVLVVVAYKAKRAERRGRDSAR